MEDQNCSQLAEMCEFDEDWINYREEALKISQDTSSIAHDIHSKLDTLMGMYRLRSEGIETPDRFETPFTGNPDVPTLKYSASPPVLGKAYNILVVGARESEDKAYRVFDEMLEIREFPGSANPIDGEMSAVDKGSDSQGIGSNESAIKHMSFIPPGIADSSLHYQHTTMEPGLMALSIYCAQMAPKWNCLLELRPRQLQDMSVESYYNQFFIWKKKLEEVNYIGDEGSYIDDFLFGLKMDIAVSVWRYKWKPRTLYGAFRSAEISETMISWKKLSLRNDVDKMFEEMSQPNYGHTAESQNAEAGPDEGRNGVRKLSELEEENENQLTSKQEDSGLCYLESEEGDDFPHLKADNPLVEMVEQSSPSKPEVIEDAHHMLGEMPHSVPVSLNSDASLFRDEGNDYLSSKIKGLRIVCQLNEEMCVVQDYTSPNGDVGQICDTGSSFFIDDGVILSFDPGGNSWHRMNCDSISEIEGSLFDTDGSFTNFSFKSKFELDVNSRTDEISMFIFDPGGSSWHLMGYSFTKSNGVKQIFDNIPSNLSVELWFGKMLMFTFDPGGSLLYYYGCDPFEYHMGCHACKGNGDLVQSRNGKGLTKFWIVAEATIEGRFLSSKTVFVKATTLGNFVWDPGLCAIVVYILEDKDVFKRVRKRLIPIDIKLVMMGRGLVLVLNEMLNILRIAYRDDEDSESDAASDFLLLKLDRHQWGNLYVFIFRRLDHAFFSGFQRTLGQLVWKELPANTISIQLLYCLPKATALNMSYCLDQPGSTWKWIEFWPLFHFWMPRVPPIAVVDVKYVLVSPCLASGCFTVLIPYMLLSFQDIRLGNIVSFGATISIESQLQKHFMGITCSYHIHWLDSWLACANLNIISKGAPYLTVVGFLEFLVTTVAGYFMEVIGSECKIGDGCVSNVNINILARQIVAKMEDFVWDPGLVWVYHFTALRTRRLLRGRICHVPRLKLEKKRSKKALVSWT